MERKTVTEMLSAIGTHVLVSFEAVRIECRVTDAKNSYGRVRLQVSPVAGSGSQWIETGRIAARVVADSPEGFATIAMLGERQ